ncbi:hypothetical protein BGZ49_002758 [Haplosporangium sp. Z 27]|nr:hypothetical protein BGZ49_002758 [Haplosporangium sp. Z 27]
MLPTTASSLWPTTPLSAALRFAVGRVSTSTPTKAILKQHGHKQIQLWNGLQGHHHQRFMSSSTRSPNGFLKASITKSSLPSRTLIAAGAVTTFIFGPLIWTRNLAYCSAGTAANPNPTIVTPTPAPTPPRTTPATAQPAAAPPSPSPQQVPGGDKDPFINHKELSFGTTMGLCSGYLCKKLGKMFVLVAGLGFVSLQLLANSGYINVNWGLIETKFTEKLDLDHDGKVTVKDAKFGLNWIIGLLTKNFQFKSTFAGGFFIGFRYG